MRRILTLNKRHGDVSTMTPDLVFWSVPPDI
jgi:hypothetical protein